MTLTDSTHPSATPPAASSQHIAFRVSIEHLKGICFRTHGVDPAKTALLREWRLYRKFPWKIILTAAEYTNYSRDNFATFSKLFSPDNGPDDILSINDTMNSVREAVARYYTYPDYSVDRYLHVYLADGVTIAPMVMKAERLKYSLYDNVNRRFNYSAFALSGDRTVETYYLTETPSFPLNESIENIKEWFYSLLSLRLEFTLMSLDLGGILGPVPFYWDVIVTYGFRSGGGEASYDIRATKRVSEPLKYGSLKTFTWLNVGIALLAVWSLWLSVWGIISNLRFYLATRRRYIGRFSVELGSSAPWESLAWTVKAQFFNLWNLTCAFGNALLLVACVLSLIASLSDSGVAEWNNVLFGVGSFLAWVNLLRYLEYYERFYVLLRTIRFSMERVASFMISVTPIYLGYALLGIICFSQYTDLFVDLDTSSVTIFSLINGDSILQAFNELENQYPYPLYLYTLITFFILSVLNIFIFLIEDAYQAARSDRDEPREVAPEFGIRQLFDALETDDNGVGIDTEESAEKSLLELADRPRQAPSRINASVEEILSENERLMKEEMREAMERIQAKYTQRLRTLLAGNSM